MKIVRRLIFLICMPLLAPVGSALRAQAAQEPSDTVVLQAAQPPFSQANKPAESLPRLSLEDALKLARTNIPEFQAAVSEAQIAREDKKLMRDALLPTINYNNEMLYTQGNGLGGPRYIANNAVHEYISQGNVHEALDLAGVYEYRRAAAGAALARARAEIASRGLVVTVVQNYFAVLAAQKKVESAQKLAQEGDDFFKLTRNLENGGEVAHSDTIKGELQMQDRKRQLQEATLALRSARLDLSVLLFHDFSDNFELAEDLHANVLLPTLEEVKQQAGRDNPDIRAALAAVQQESASTSAARAGYLPTLTIDYFYGIDAAQFATNSVIIGRKFPNLGSSASASVTIPIWNWGATQSRVKQAELRQAQAKRELSFAQRKLLAEIQSRYDEAQTSLNELSGLGRSAEPRLGSFETCESSIQRRRNDHIGSDGRARLLRSRGQRI